VKTIRSRYAVVSGDGVTIRRKASRTSEAVTQVDAGTRVVVLDRNGDWYRLRFPRGTEGWVRGDLLKAAAAPHVAERRQRRKASYVAKRHHKSSGGHHSVSEPVVAYEASSKAGDGNNILARAETFRGVRYRWGSMSRSGTDCSGFTSQVFKANGYRLPRTSSEQSHVGKAVRAKDMKKGDLVFFHTRRGQRVTHVGIYMGGGKFIHASSGGGKVQVNSLNDGYYKERLVGARRVTK